MIEIINRLLERVLETGETIESLTVNEEVREATLKDDTGDTLTVDYNTTLGFWE